MRLFLRLQVFQQRDFPFLIIRQRSVAGMPFLAGRRALDLC